METRLNEIKDSDKYIHKNECKNLKQKLKQFYEKQTEAAKIRSRVKNFEEGEKSTRYFYNLEKHNISNKTWTKIKCKDGTVKTDIHSILSEQTTFFKELLTSDDINLIEANSLLNNVDAKLNDEERDFCEKDVSSEEIFKIIKQLKPNKSPGDDGIISEFYKIYWYLIKRELTDVIKYSLENDTLSKTQYNAIITLLYKKGNREDISNWRPISLLNTDYKIITKILAERLKLFLPKLHDTISWLNDQNIHLDLNEKSFLFCFPGDQDNDVNKLVLMELKYHIYSAKCSKNYINLPALKHRLKLLYKTFKQASIIEEKYESFTQKWQNYHILFQ